MSVQLLEVLVLHVPLSEDGNSEFARVADILDHLATMYAWHPECYAFLLTRANEARAIDQKSPPTFPHLSKTKV